MGEQKYEFGLNDYIQLSLWYVVLYGFVSWQGWLVGVILYVAFLHLAAKVCKAVLGLEMMSGGDEMFFLDDDRNSLNIIAFHRYDRISDVENFRKTMVRRACKFPRLKSHVRKIFGKFMFSETTNEEMMNSVNKVMPIIGNIHTEQELADYMAKEQSYRLPLDGLQWRVYLIPDYSATESVFVYKVHHSLADGIANILFFNDMTDEPKLEGYPNLLIRFSFLQDISIKLMMPFYLLWLAFKLVILMKNERNGFKTPAVTEKLTSLKNYEMIPDICLNDVKKRAAELTTPRMKVTINDVLMTVLSKTINDYLRKHTDDKETKFVQMACPFSLRPPPAFLGDFTFDNNFAIVNLNLRLIDSFDGLSQINRDMIALKKSIEPIGLYYLIKIMM